MTAGRDIAFWALGQHGKHYVWGATGPDTFDCSGLVWADLEHFGIKEHRGYRTAEALYQWCRKSNSVISVNDARHIPGALLFVHRGQNKVHHVAMSLGTEDTDIEAASSHANPEIGTYHIGNRFDFAGLVPVGVDYSQPAPTPTPPPPPHVDPPLDPAQAFWQFCVALVFATKVSIINKGALRPGDSRHDCVKVMQSGLNMKGVGIKLNANGIYDQETAKAVNYWRFLNKLPTNGRVDFDQDCANKLWP